MRILTDARLLVKGGSSGIEEYSKSLFQEILKIDQENDYVFFSNSFRKSAINLNFGDTKSEFLNFGIPNKILDFSSRFLRWPSVGKIAGADLVFSPHFNILESGKIPRVITFHDLSFIHHPYFFSWKQRFWHWLQNIRRQAKKAARIIAVSEFTKGDLINLLEVPENKIQVIYSGVSENFRKLEIKNREGVLPFILYLGTLEPRKNVSAIIKAFNILKKSPVFKDWQLVIAGRPGWLYKNILREAVQSPFKNEIIFKGHVGEKERILLYNLAEVFIYPSFFEGFGFPPLEAQACGCPVIVSDRTSLPEVVGDSAVLINPWKVEELAGAVKEVVSDERKKSRLIKSGYENVKKFNWRKTAAETLKLINDV